MRAGAGGRVARRLGRPRRAVGGRGCCLLLGVWGLDGACAVLMVAGAGAPLRGCALLLYLSRRHGPGAWRSQLNMQTCTAQLESSGPGPPRSREAASVRQQRLRRGP
jgi:hypothetical protein